MRLAPNLIAAAFAIGCTQVPAPGPEQGSRGLQARDVVVEIPALGGQIVARGARLNADRAGGLVSISGDASVAFAGRSRLEARAERITVDPAGPVVDLEGRVRATFRAPAGGGADAGR
ncbi:MAG: hypothetical protein PHU25_02185 [Deltaproteobacteria bacterium]|nr:hypothetical protein [Deltaproteobacteria bacterium]